MRCFVRKKDIPYIIGTIILGSISHFLYDFSGENPFLALFTPVNESTWEHLKLLFFPVLFFTAWEYYQRTPNLSALFGSRLVGVWAGMATIVILFYGYTFVTQKPFLILDIAIYVIGVWMVFYTSAKLHRVFFYMDSLYIFFGWVISVLLFFFFTVFPPEIFLFLSPELGV